MLCFKSISVIFLIAFVQLGENANILFFIPMSTTSEKHFFEPLFQKLASNGHNLTVVTNNAEKHPHKNVKEIIPISVEEIYGSVCNISVSTQEIFWDLIFLDMSEYIPQLDKIYTNAEVQAVMNEKYDLIFTNLFFGQAFYGFIHQNQCPFILMHTYPVSNYFLKDWGMHMPSSHIPYPLLDYTDKMNFGQRLKNFLVDWAVYFQVEFYQIPLFEDVYRRHLGQHLPSVKEIQKNASLMMMNTHFLTTYHRPTMPDVIEIGGLHIKDSKPLPQDLEQLLGHSAAPDGFIFMSFGSVLKGSSLPDEIRLKFLNVFSRLKQKVVWKWESEDMQNLPHNVILKKWLPQQDILGHSNIRLFVSHGGLLSTQQTIYHGVNVIMFPFFFDQMTNAMGAEESGIGLKLDIWSFTEEELEKGINKILQESKFKTKVELQSKIFRDQMNSPLERAVFWTEHVLKYDGAPHLRSSARHLNFIQLHSFDVIGFILSLLIICTLIVTLLIRSICKCWSSPNQTILKQKRL